MRGNSACRHVNDASSQPVTPQNEPPIDEQRQRWFEDALEDDEVQEALVLLSAKEETKND